MGERKTKLEVYEDAQHIKNDDTDRIIGALIEFKGWAKDEFAALKLDMEELKKLKWQIYGGAVVVSSVTGVIIEVVRAFLK